MPFPQSPFMTWASRLSPGTEPPEESMTPTDIRILTAAIELATRRVEELPELPSEELEESLEGLRDAAMSLAGAVTNYLGA